MLDANLSDDDEFKLVLLVLRQRQPLKDVRRNANDFQPVVLHNLNPGQQHLKSVVVEAGSCNERLSMLSKNTDNINASVHGHEPYRPSTVSPLWGLDEDRFVM